MLYGVNVCFYPQLHGNDTRFETAVFISVFLIVESVVNLNCDSSNETASYFMKLNSSFLLCNQYFPVVLFIMPY